MEQFLDKYLSYILGGTIGIGFVIYSMYIKKNHKARNNLSDRVIRTKKQNLAIEKQTKGMFPK